MNYQEQAIRTLADSKPLSLKDTSLVMGALGLAGEAGETADYIKKVIFHGNPLDKDILKKELGDVCWYIAAICQLTDLSFDDVLKSNIEKLKRRHPYKFTQETAQAKIDQQ